MSFLFFFFWNMLSSSPFYKNELFSISPITINNQNQTLNALEIGLYIFLLHFLHIQIIYLEYSSEFLKWVHLCKVISFFFLIQLNLFLCFFTWKYSWFSIAISLINYPINNITWTYLYIHITWCYNNHVLNIY